MPRDLLLFALSLSALGLAFPPFRLGFFACWAIIPFLLLLENKSAATAFRWGYGAGLLANLITLHSVFLIPSFERIVAVLVTPAGFGLLAAVLARLHKARPVGYLLAVPFLWTMLEYAQARGSQGMAGLPLGYTQEYYASLMRHAFGDSVFLISFWVVAINVILLMLWRRRDNLLWLSGLGALLIAFLLLPYAFSKLAWRDFDFFHENVIDVRRAPLPEQFARRAGGRTEAPELFVHLGF